LILAVGNKILHKNIEEPVENINFFVDKNIDDNSLTKQKQEI